MWKHRKYMLLYTRNLFFKILMVVFLGNCMMCFEQQTNSKTLELFIAFLLSQLSLLTQPLLLMNSKWYSWYARFASLHPYSNVSSQTSRKFLKVKVILAESKSDIWWKVECYSPFQPTAMFHLTHQLVISRKWSLAFSKSFIGLTTRQGKLLHTKIKGEVRQIGTKVFIGPKLSVKRQFSPKRPKLG